MFPGEAVIPEGVEPFPLSGDALRGWLVTSGQSLLTSFGSGAEALDFLRLNGVAIRTADFYQIYNQVNDLANLITTQEVPLSVAEAINPNGLIPLGYTIFDSGYSLSSDFLYRFKITSTNPMTGEQSFSYMAVGSDVQLTFNEAHDLMSTMFTGEYTEEGYNVTDVSISAAFGNPSVFQ